MCLRAVGHDLLVFLRLESPFLCGEPESFQVSPPISDDEDDFDPFAPYEFSEGTFEFKRQGAPPKMKKFGRYPFMPSMLAGRDVLHT